MNYKLFISILLLFISLGGFAQTKIVCIGNSISQGKVSRGVYKNTSIGDSLAEMSYRFYLWEKMDSAGYKVEFVGYHNKYYRQNNNDYKSKSRYTGNLFNNSNEAYYGIKSGEFLNGKWVVQKGGIPTFSQRLETYDPPDVAFIHIGTNDVKLEKSYTVKSIDEIVKTLRKRNATVTIFLARLISDWVHISPHMEQLAASLTSEESEVIFVDLATGFINNPTVEGTLTYDWLHPNRKGQLFMAERWFKAFENWEKAKQ